MTRRTGAFCSLLLILTLIHGVFSQSRLRRDVYFWVEGFIALLILFCATLLCDVFIKFQEEKNNIIRLDYLNQLLLQDKLNKDPKTGLYAHEIFKNTLNHKIKNAENTGKPVVLAVIDIDNFKKINDIYGHLKGDQVIITLANVMKKYKNDHCFISRFGGEEFAVIFTEVETQQAYALLEKLRLEFQDEKYNFTEQPITISIGLAKWEPGLTAESLFNQADAAMYASKAKGKNRTELYKNTGGSTYS